MKKKIMFALTAIAMGLGLSSVAIASSTECRSACNKANYYCNVALDAQLCTLWNRSCIGCQGNSEV